MVLGKLDDDAAFFDENSAAIAGIGAVVVLLGDEHDAASGAGVLRVVFLAHFLIDFEEAAVERALVIHLLPLGLSLQHLHEVVFDVLGDLCTAVAVEDPDDKTNVATR